MGKYFGTDGFRGEANVTLNVEHAYKVGRYLGWYFGREHKARVVIGKIPEEAAICLNMHWLQVLRHQEQMHICCMLQRLRVCLMLSEQRSSIAES